MFEWFYLRDFWRDFSLNGRYSALLQELQAPGSAMHRSTGHDGGEFCLHFGFGCIWAGLLNVSKRYC